MKITCEKDALTSAFMLVGSAAPTRSPKEILQNVKVLASESGLLMQATDMETGISTKVTEGVEVIQGGELLLPVQRMSAILREWEAESVSIEVEDNTIRVTGGRGNYRLNSQNPQEFPDVQRFEETSFHEMDPRGLAVALQRTVYATDPDSSRFALGGVKMEADQTGIIVVGTDGRRLAKQVFSASAVDGHEFESSVIIPTRAVGMIRNALTKVGQDELVQVSSSLNDVKITAGASTLWTRLIEGRFPNWQMVFPNEREEYESTTILAGVLANVVRQASIMTDSESRGITLGFGRGSLSISASTAELGSSSVETVIPYEGDSIQITVDNRYLTDICKVLDGDRLIEIQFKSAGSPMLLSTDDGYQCVVMPMQK